VLADLARLSSDALCLKGQWETLFRQGRGVNQAVEILRTRQSETKRDESALAAFSMIRYNTAAFNRIKRLSAFGVGRWSAWQVGERGGVPIQAINVKRGRLFNAPNSDLPQP
jgi:hypothetical protein